MAAPRADGPCGHLRAFGRPAFDRPESWPRRDRRGRTARLWAGTKKTDRDRLAVATATGSAKSFARAPDADRTGGGEKENKARRPGGSRFLPGAHQPCRRSAHICAFAALVGAQ